MTEWGIALGLFTRILSHLDRHIALGFRTWDFSARSLSHEYGRVFLAQAVLRHPLHAIRGALAYRHFARGDLDIGNIRHLYTGDEEAFLYSVAGEPETFLVGLGFCLKPMTVPHSNPGCPSGRFNHDCEYLSSLEISESTPSPRHPACQGCLIGEVGVAALQAGVNMHVLTSAAEIAHDILFPSLERRRFRHVFFAICPYSVEPMSLALSICGLDGYIARYSAGNCVDFEMWIRADRGIKKERTLLDPPTYAKLLDTLAEISRLRSKPARCFRREGNIYIPYT
ncbi:MAG: hypothetical protein H5T64_00780 [Chloroflexi bacterium]|nr:hypothetical protein [Chloroflexota bacterium]